MTVTETRKVIIKETKKKLLNTLYRMSYWFFMFDDLSGLRN